VLHGLRLILGQHVKSHESTVSECLSTRIASPHCIDIQQMARPYTADHAASFLLDITLFIYVLTYLLTYCYEWAWIWRSVCV